MKLVKLNPKKHEENECSEIAKELYERCKSGEVEAFLVVALDPEDNTSLFIGNNKDKRRTMIHFLGAAWMLNHYIHDVIEENSEE